MPDWEQIAKYLSGDCSAKERAEFNAWLDTNAENRVFFEAQKSLWIASEAGLGETTVDTETALKSLHRTIDNQTQKVRKASGWLKYAAVMAMVFVSSLLWFVLQGPSEVTVVNTTDRPMTVSLADGSYVWLNKQAQLIYNDDMVGELREVQLIGEAYFDIYRQPEKPFLIYSEGVTVHVLGTEFNVKSNDTKRVIVDVLEGSVDFYQNNNRENGLKLKAFEVGVFNKQSGVVERGVEQDLNNIAWKTGVLRFNEEKLPAVAEYLQTYYAIDVVIGEGLKNCTITTVFDNLLLNETLEILELTLGITIEKTDTGIVLSGSCSR